MMSKDYYSILWVERGASADDIKKAYRKKAMDSHPDRHGWDKEKEEEFKSINEAYAVLSDAQKKARYDQFGSAEWWSGGFGGMGGFDFGDINVEDIFSSVFGNMWGFGGRRQQYERWGRWEDVQKEIHITVFLRAMREWKKKYILTKWSTVRAATVTEQRTGKKQKNALTCHGSGYVSRATRSIFGMMQQTLVCDTCGGAVSDYRTSLSWHVVVKKESKKKPNRLVEIPAGIDDGMTLRINGEGHAGKHTSGDLYISCHVDQTHENLWWDKAIIYITTLHISPAEAVLGSE
jgi:molecular chaperone DnaJ